ncbi:MAG: hypothetical protein Q8K59_03430 [Nitrosomonas sp.]|nr:hypothetical protein [Nitrosomonas sp.]MDP1950140.1 hypothetical protein [Nitrosomonas sp.]
MATKQGKQASRKAAARKIGFLEVLLRKILKNYDMQHDWLCNNYKRDSMWFLKLGIAFGKQSFS